MFVECVQRFERRRKKPITSELRRHVAVVHETTVMLAIVSLPSVGCSADAWGALVGMSFAHSPNDEGEWTAIPHALAFY